MDSVFKTRLTIIHPAIGHKIGENYIRSWQMEPLPAAAIAGLTPDSVEVRFYDDRMETLPFDEPTDAVAMSVETYTAKRVYQIASEYRRRGVPVILGGFHATLQPEEVSRYADAIVIGEAERVWPELVDDLLHGSLQRVYENQEAPDLSHIQVDRSIFAHKNYLPIALVETGRGCRFPCDFCAIQTVFKRTHRSRPVDAVIRELIELKPRTRLFFFVDDNFAGNIKRASEFLHALQPLNIKWVTQMSINAAHDEDFLQLLARSGCKGVLIGFESLDEANLKAMQKGFNAMKGGYPRALANLRRHNIRVYGTFVFGYDHDKHSSFDEAVQFAIDEKLYIAAFNHLTPFPGTPLYDKLQSQGRLRYKQWWLDEAYRYNDVPFIPHQLQPQDVTRLCVQARRRFYSINSILKRGFDKTNRSDSFMFRNYFPINFIHRADVDKRNGYPLGDERWQGNLLPV
ncbi:MAG: B12-binding domain-containing radical SAM protein [Gammaproteobacteria bacterium]|nr:B12-binding domain-containing radical SAM protein [Gammaproteobacteria bacterium]MDH5802280.1 B12-binding domain-containing radical SAM protein [Gammaproteobacteria bacterium]